MKFKNRENKLLNITEMADLLRIDRQTFYYLIRAELIDPPTFLKKPDGDRKHYRKSELSALERKIKFITVWKGNALNERAVNAK